MHGLPHDRIECGVVLVPGEEGEYALAWTEVTGPGRKCTWRRVYCQEEEWWGAPVDIGAEAGWVAHLDIWQAAAGGAPLEAAVVTGVLVCVGLGPPLDVVGSRAEEQRRVSTVRKIPEGT